MHSLSIFGTSSDAGKSTLTFVIGKLLQEQGIKVVPFKAQNVSNNAHVCDDNKEIAIAQYFQAEVLEVETSYHLNPILLKSGRGNQASLIVEGEVVENKDVRAYYKDLDSLKPAVKRCFEQLKANYDCVICEGAGSPVELNLMDKDLSNIFIANEYNNKIILIADIEKGGVFASIYGVYHLLPKKLRENVIGVIVNKFRGDMSLFDEGVRIIKEQFKIPVLGVLPYKPFNFGFEDSASLKNYVQTAQHRKLSLAVINYPTMSNYNDFEPLISDQEVFIEFIEANQGLDAYDLIILPGSKLVIQDLKWLKKSGLFESIQQSKKPILGICGGYEMLFEKLHDPYALENIEPCVEEGLGFIDDEITFKKNKVLKKGKYELFGVKEVEGFEIHHGESLKYPLSYDQGRVKGCFVHGLFANDQLRQKLFKALSLEYNGFEFKRLKKETIEDFISHFKDRLDVDRIVTAIKE